MQSAGLHSGAVAGLGAIHGLHVQLHFARRSTALASRFLMPFVVLNDAAAVLVPVATVVLLDTREVVVHAELLDLRTNLSRQVIN